MGDLRFAPLRLVLATLAYIMPAKDKHFSLFLAFLNYDQKSFISLTPVANVIKLFLSVIY